ncbi:MAG: sugar porter family MFS transporter [Candidatus Glassbacteria bacterium]
MVRETDSSRPGPADYDGSLAYVIFISSVASLGGLLFGYDTAVISGAIGSLQQKFGLGPAMTGWAVSCALAGCIAGVAAAGAASDRFGRKKVLIAAAVCYFVSAVGTALPRNITEFIIFRTIGGLGVGAASMAAPLYIAEVSPAWVRGRTVSINQFAIVSGILLVYFVNWWIAGLGDQAWNVETGWRWMFGSEALPAAGLLVLLFFVPESPRWLVRWHRDEEARAVLTRTGGERAAGREIEEIRATLAGDRGSLRELVGPGLRRLLLVGIALAVLQQVTGINVIIYYSSEIFKKMGAATDTALLQTVTVGVVNLSFTIVAIWTVDYLGRRPLMLVGAAGMGIALIWFGCNLYQGYLGNWNLFWVLFYIASFASSMGPVAWVVLAEIFPNRVRGRAMAVATISLWAANLVVSQTFPMLNDNPWLVATFHRAFPFWVYAALCAVTVVFVLFCIPETKGRSLEQIERMLGGEDSTGPVAR